MVLKQFEELNDLEQKISTYNVKNLDKDLLLEAKQKGFADRQIAYMLDCVESEVYNLREKNLILIEFTNWWILVLLNFRLKRLIIIRLLKQK